MDNEQLQQQRLPSVLSGEWMTLPSLSVPVEDMIGDEDDNDDKNTSHYKDMIDDKDDKDMINDNERAERIMNMECDIRGMQAQGDTSTSSWQDCALFLALYEKFLSPENDVPLQQEMMIEMLEDLGELVLGLREDLEHLKHLRHAIKQIVS
ncbi:hypothetical protein BGZ93_009922 [Podila epicladia]|nr:hypothetical protein BGZ92_003268 [Podila epicladia]KAG0089334.1 hypothetical protein BGZ93_009922 [Podila epicladia]